MISFVVFCCSVELDFKLQEDKLQPLMKRLCPTTDVHFAPLPYPQEAFTSTPKRKSKSDSKKHARWKLWFLWEPTSRGQRRIQRLFGHPRLSGFSAVLVLSNPSGSYRFGKHSSARNMDTKIEGWCLGVPLCWKLPNVTKTKNEVISFLNKEKKKKVQKANLEISAANSSCCLFIILAGPVPFLLNQSRHCLLSLEKMLAFLPQVSTNSISLYCKAQITLIRILFLQKNKQELFWVWTLLVSMADWGLSYWFKKRPNGQNISNIIGFFTHFLSAAKLSP